MLAAGAEPIVYLVYGEQWSRSADVFFYLSFSMFAATSANTAGWRFISLGQTNRMLRWSVFATCIRLPAFAASVAFGILAFAQVYSIITFLLLPLNLWYFTRKSPLKLQSLLQINLPLIGAGFFAVFLSRRLLPPLESNGHALAHLIQVVSLSLLALLAYSVSALILGCFSPTLRHHAFLLHRRSIQYLNFFQSVSTKPSAF